MHRPHHIPLEYLLESRTCAELPVIRYVLPVILVYLITLVTIDRER
jgi:hypothetical protein